MKLSSLCKSAMLSAFLISGTLLHTYILYLLYQEKHQKPEAVVPSKNTFEELPKAKTSLVYRTRNGSKYHYNPHCSPNDYYTCSLEEAQNAGLTPCLRCVVPE